MPKLCKALFIALAAFAYSGTANSQSNATLSAQDYVDIRNLIDTYPRILDYCIGAGEGYANLFTDDATFGVSSTWGSGAKIWFRGREQLKAIGGGNGCGTPGGSGYHLNINPAIVPTAEGASSTSTLLTIINDTDSRGDVVHWEGGYEDTFEKTAAGWRFKSRVHVWPEVEWTADPADMPPRNVSEE